MSRSSRSWVARIWSAAAGGEYYGPGGLAQVKGYPVRVSSTARSRDQAAQRRLWAESERLTGVTYPV